MRATERTMAGLLLAAAAAGWLPAIDPAGWAFGQAGGSVARSDVLRPMDVFDLEWVSEPRISPDGRRVVYVRNGFDIMTDRRTADLWMIGTDGSDHRALTSLPGTERSPRWSPDGSRILYLSDGEGENGTTRLWIRWVGTDDRAPIATLSHAPSELEWSPDGKWIAFSMFVPEATTALVPPSDQPAGADWGPPFVEIDQLEYRADGDGYLEQGYTQIFVLPAEGGTPRQLTAEPYPHDGGLSWTPDGSTVVVSARRREDWRYEPRDTEIYEVSVADGSVRQLSDRRGPDADPAVSPDGSMIAYVGSDERYQGYQVTELFVMDRGGGHARSLTSALDRDAENPAWSADGTGLYFQYDDEGNTKLAFVTLNGDVRVLAQDVGGLSLGRPYAGGAYSVASDGRFAFTVSTPAHPADLAVGGPGPGMPRRLTALNDDLLRHRRLAEVEEMWLESSYDGRPIQAWIAKPPGFDPTRKYPLILEIHGGPFANYGDRFSAEVQLYAAAGYMVLYVNPRGSTSYGAEFGNLIHHAYPSQDYDDLMSAVDAVLERGYVDEQNLFVTGGSGGGVLTAWIVGKTDRFRAAVSAKPVINWYSFVLTADRTSFFSRWWFPGFPWEQPEQYLARSPLSLVGNVTTPTMLMTGEEDYRTPISESEQFYAALKLRGVPAMLVRIPDASHGIADKPSNLMAKVDYILAWFDRYRTGEPRSTAGPPTP